MALNAVWSLHPEQKGLWTGKMDAQSREAAYSNLAQNVRIGTSATDGPPCVKTFAHLTG